MATRHADSYIYMVKHDERLRDDRCVCTMCSLSLTARIYSQLHHLGECKNTALLAKGSSANQKGSRCESGFCYECHFPFSPA